MLFVPSWKFVLFAICVILGTFAQSIPKTSFSCDGRTSGYYADVSTGCQVYHMCDGLGRQFSYKCPSKTLFQQRMLICDHWYMVNCSKAEEDYSANLLIGQRGKAFIEDPSFHRTPRPDLSDPGNSDYDTYRVGELETQATKNLVDSTTPSTSSKREESGSVVPGFVKQIFYKTTYNTNRLLSNNIKANNGKDVDANKNGNTLKTNSKSETTKYNVNKGESIFKSQPQPQQNIIPPENDKTVQNQESNISNGVNFPSRFKATTPVYPEHVDVDLSKFTDFANPIELEQNAEEETVSVNFPSKFKATTPVYPKHVDTDPSRLSEFDIPLEQNPVETVMVNFASNFKATTPVYPKHVDVDLSKFAEFEELPPEQTPQENVVVNFASNFKATTPVYPKQVDVDLSKFLEPVELPFEDKDNKNGSANFASNFKATTPVYPQTVDQTSPIPEEAGLLPPFSSFLAKTDVNQSENSIQVNFPSNFQATTPNYPTSVEPTSPDPNEAGLVVPQLSAKLDPQVPSPSPDIIPPDFDKTFSRRADEYDPSVLGNTFNSKQFTEFMVTMKPEQLRDLKELWHIPDYDFPLETASRPSYGSEFSSFEAKSVNKR